jgi:hypothetical protein
MLRPNTITLDIYIFLSLSLHQRTDYGKKPLPRQAVNPAMTLEKVKSRGLQRMYGIVVDVVEEFNAPTNLWRLTLPARTIPNPH